MKKQLLGLMLLSGALLVGCQSNSAEPVEKDEPVVVNEQEQKEAEEAERRKHIDEIRKEINGEQEEMTTEEYFEQQRKEESEEARRHAENWREYNDIIVDGYGDLTEQKEETEKPKEKSYLEIVSEIRGEKIEEGLTYDNFLLVGQVDFNSVYSINELFGTQGKLIGEQQGIKQYRWTQGSGSTYKVVQIMFVDGKVESKTQSGL